MARDHLCWCCQYASQRNSQTLKTGRTASFKWKLFVEPLFEKCGWIPWLIRKIRQCSLDSRVCPSWTSQLTPSRANWRLFSFREQENGQSQPHPRQLSPITAKPSAPFQRHKEWVSRCDTCDSRLKCASAHLCLIVLFASFMTWLCHHYYPWWTALVSVKSNYHGMNTYLEPLSIGKLIFGLNMDWPAMVNRKSRHIGHCYHSSVVCYPRNLPWRRSMNKSLHQIHVNIQSKPVHNAMIFHIRKRTTLPLLTQWLPFLV